MDRVGYMLLEFELNGGITMGRRKVGRNSGYNGKEKVWYMEGSKVYRRLRGVCEGVEGDRRVKVVCGGGCRG